MDFQIGGVSFCTAIVVALFLKTSLYEKEIENSLINNLYLRKIIVL